MFKHRSAYSVFGILGAEHPAKESSISETVKGVRQALNVEAEEISFGKRSVIHRKEKALHPEYLPEADTKSHASQTYKNDKKHILKLIKHLKNKIKKQKNKS